METSKKKKIIVAKRKGEESKQTLKAPVKQPVKTPVKPMANASVKIDTKKANADFEKTLKKREQLLREEKDRQRQIREGLVVAKKNRRIFQITTALTFALLLIFAPIFPNRELSLENTNYLSARDLDIKHPLKSYFSPFQFVRYSFELRNGSDYIKTSTVSYNLREMSVKAHLSEYKPLVKDVENNVYFREDGETIKMNGLDIYAPIISGFDTKTLDKLLESMKSLDYSIIMQIDTIEYAGTEEDPELLKLGMAGDNTVYINMGQIKTKLPYYNQIKQIIDEKAKGKPGIIHLDIGDYYEPK